jgi:superfamily II DNA or RNA helicase
MSVDLRPYQLDAVAKVRESFRWGSRAPLLVAPTGAGKTVIFCYIAQAAVARGNRVMVLAHRTELLDQTSRALTRLGVAHGMIAAGRTPDWQLPVQVAGVHTLIRRLGRVIPPDLIVVDEAHHAAAGSWRAILQAFPHARVLGVTATPERLDGKGLGDVFDDLIRGPEVRELIDAGWLSRPVYYAPEEVDLSGIRKTGGDYNRKDLDELMQERTLTGSAVEHYQRFADGIPAIAFCISIKHAEATANAFRKAGIPWQTIDGNMTPEARRQAVEDLATGKVRGLSSCDIVSEGFDLPVVGAAILLRPTMSLALYLQQVGRCLRPYPGKERAIILDHAGNVLKHGLAEQVREWSLEGKAERPNNSEPVKRCKLCFSVFVGPRCPNCAGSEEEKERSVCHVDGELKELTAERMQEIANRSKKDEQREAKTFDDLVRLGTRRGYRNPSAWAYHILKARSGRRYQTA